MPGTRPANPLGRSRIGFFVFPIAVLAVLNFLTAPAQGSQDPAGITRAKLRPGDILYADSGNGVDGGFIIKVDPNSGEQTVISAGGNLISPFDVALDAQGQLIVSDSGSCCKLIRIDPGTGQQTVIEDSSRQTLGAPLGLAVGSDGGVLVANAQTLVRWDPSTGAMQTVSSNGNFVAPIGVAIAGSAEVFVLNQAFPPQILRVDPTTGGQVVVSAGGYLHSPQSIVAKNRDLYVSDVADPNGSFGVGRVIHIDARTGLQNIVSEGGNLVGPVGITLNQAGQIVVGDPYTINPNSPDLYDGAIIRIEPGTGAQTLIVRGRGSFVNPRGVAVVPSGLPAMSPPPGF